MPGISVSRISSDSVLADCVVMMDGIVIGCDECSDGFGREVSG